MPPNRSTIRRRRALALLVVAAGVVAALLVISAASHSTSSSQGQALDPSEFAPGACVAFSPTAGDRHETVFLDAGHGGLDPGGLGTTRSGGDIDEAEETLPVELEAATILRSDGFRVVVSRTGNSTVVRLTSADVTQGTLTLQGAHEDVVARDQCADDAGAQALVGIYYDAGSSPENAGSITAYDADRTFSVASHRLATLVQHDVLTRMNAKGWAIPDIGVQTDDQLGSLDGDPATGGLAAAAAAYHHLLLLGPADPGYFASPSTMPGAVIEPLFITDPYEGSIAASNEGRTAIATGIATAIEQFLNHSSS